MSGEHIDNDTIAAIATPPGRGGIGIVRISGPLTLSIARGVISRVPEPRKAIHTPFLDTQSVPIDVGIAIFYPRPRSFTGEDVLELQGHGGPVVMDLLLERVLSLGARLARPGEFSERAYLNDKIDLAQAEAVADLIESQTAQAARCALRSLQGEFSGAVHSLVENLIEFRIFIEAALDFPEEEIDFLADETIIKRLEGLRTQLNDLMQKARQGSLLQEGIKLVITGRPNAGKSSLLNKLTGHDAAIVSDIPGTTRDVMHREVQLAGIPLKIIDTAGFHSTSNPIELEGIRRAEKELESADMVLLLMDATCGYGIQEKRIEKNISAEKVMLKVWNKIDLVDRVPTHLQDDVYISAKTGQGLDSLRYRMKLALRIQESSEGIFSARRRHLQALSESLDALNRTYELLEKGKGEELVAEELHLTQTILGQITGKFTSEDLLERIFSGFCIGK